MFSLSRSDETRGGKQKGTHRVLGAAGPSLRPLPAEAEKSGSADYTKEPLSVSSREAAVFVDARSEGDDNAHNDHERCQAQR